MEPILNYQNPNLNPEYLQQAASNKSQDRELQAAREFEAVFAQMALKEMRPKMEGGLFNSGLGEEMFYQMLDEAIAKEISNSENNFGIADQLMQQNFK